MTTRPFNDCLTLALALCGVPDANTVEVNRVKAFINMAARRAYGESDCWPRWLRTEERIVSEDGLLPYSEDGKEDIEVCRRIFATEPFEQCGAAEYPDYYAKNDGIQIAGYVPRELSTPAIYLDIEGTTNPDISGRLLYVYSDEDGHPFYSSNSATSAPATGTWQAVEWSLSWWQIVHTTDGLQTGFWIGTPSDVDYATPDLVPTWEPQLLSTGTPTLVIPDLYSAWVTYKAAFSTTYATGDDFPAEWFDYCAYAAYAHFLRNDGQQEKAAVEDSLAYATYLVPQLEKLDNQSGGHVFTRILTHGNTQAR